MNRIHSDEVVQSFRDFNLKPKRGDFVVGKECCGLGARLLQDKGGDFDRVETILQDGRGRFAAVQEALGITRSYAVGFSVGWDDERSSCESLDYLQGFADGHNAWLAVQQYFKKSK